MELNFSLHEKQLEVLQSEVRFKVCAAGRRGGKSYLSGIMLLMEGLKDTDSHGNDLKNKEVFYVAPTFQQAKDIMWNLLKDLGHDLIKNVWENTATIELINGRRIRLKGSDRPDTLRGVGVSFIVMDEYAFMKPEVWDLILRPTLSDVQGTALFIGTPEGKNHFYDIWIAAQRDDMEEWEAFQFNSLDNPIIKESELNEARLTMTAEGYRQEYEASFEAKGAGAFKESDILYDDEPRESGTIYMTVDPAGYGNTEGLSKSGANKLDEFAIAVVEVSPSGWFVHDIIAGRWGVREASLQVITAAKKYQPAAVGIESGSLKNALMPYLDDQMKRLGVYPRIEPVTHGGQKKTERITWALQGRFQNKRITLKNADWNKKFTDQLLDFPNKMVHDDLVDALAYIDQIENTVYDFGFIPEEYVPLDPDIGI